MSRPRVLDTPAAAPIMMEPAEDANSEPSPEVSSLSSTDECTEEYARIPSAAPPNSVFTSHKGLSKIVATMNEVRALIQASVSAGLENSIKIPAICVVGEQSAGKSSLLQQLLGVPIFPRADGTCTRSPFAVEVITMSPDDLFAEVIPAGTKDVSKAEYEKHTYILRFGPDEKEEFSFDPAAVQRHITTIWQSLGNSMSPNEIRVRIYSTTLPALAFVDLPGLLMTVSASNSTDTRDAIQKMSETYARKEHNVVLVVHLSAADFEVGKGIAVAREFDTTGKRTIIALSKMDRCAETSIKRFLSGAGNPWGDAKPEIFGVRCPAVNEDQDTYAAFKGCNTIKEAQDAEAAYFTSKDVFRKFSNNLGTRRLAQSLSDLLAIKLQEQFIPVRDQVSKLLEESQGKRRALGDPGLTDEPHLLSRFNVLMGSLQQALSTVIEGGSSGAELEGGALLCDHFGSQFSKELAVFEEKANTIAAQDAETLKKVENQIRNSHGREQYLPFPTKEVVMNLVKQVFGKDFCELKSTACEAIGKATQILIRLIDPLLDPSNDDCPDDVARELKVRKALSSFTKHQLRKFLDARSKDCQQKMSRHVEYCANAFGSNALHSYLQKEHAARVAASPGVLQPLLSLFDLNPKLGAHYSTSIAKEKVKADCKEMAELAPKCFFVEVAMNLFREFADSLGKDQVSLKSIYRAMAEDPAIAKQREELDKRIQTLQEAYDKLMEAE